MPSVIVVKRTRKDKDGRTVTDAKYSAQIRFGHPHNASYLRSTGEADRRKAEAAARKIAKTIEENELPRRGTEILTVEDMFAKWIEEHGKNLRSGKDLAWQIKKILQHISGTRPVSELGNKDINGFVQDAKEQGDSAVTINRCLETFRAMMNYAADRWEEPVRRISWRTMRQKEPKAREVYLSPEDARRLAEILPEHIALAMAFTLYTGVRLNELETLTWERIDFDRNVASVLTKGGGTRSVWLSKNALHILETLGVHFQAPSSEYIFDLTNRRKFWEAARTRIHRPDIHWHDLRAMTATWARKYSQQRDLSLIGKALGHSGTQVTERYARVVDQEIVEMLNQLPEITGPAATGRG